MKMKKSKIVGQEIWYVPEVFSNIQPSRTGDDPVELPEKSKPLLLSPDFMGREYGEYHVNGIAFHRQQLCRDRLGSGEGRICPSCSFDGPFGMLLRVIEIQYSEICQGIFFSDYSACFIKTCMDVNDSARSGFFPMLHPGKLIKC